MEFDVPTIYTYYLNNFCEEVILLVYHTHPFVNRLNLLYLLTGTNISKK